MFYLFGMLLHFLLQRMMGDPFASMNLFVVAFSAMAVSSLKEFKEKLSISNILSASIVAVLISYGVLLVLPVISSLLAYPATNVNPGTQELVIILALNFSICFIVLRFRNKHWGITSHAGFRIKSKTD